MAAPSFLKSLLANWKLIFTLIYPILLCPILIKCPGSEGKGAYTLLLMAGYWITECISIYITAMLPLLMGPLMGIMASKTLCSAYMKDAIMLFIHGAFLALAAEHRNIHRRIGNAVIRIMGGDPRLLLLGLMLPTWFLSMWMSNAAATIMMLTIVDALLGKLESLKPSKFDVEEGIALRNDEEWNTGDSNESVTTKTPTDTEDLDKLACAFSLGVAYASSCGGMGTVIGTPTNVVLFGLVASRYGSGTGLNFGSWAAYGAPLSLIMVIATWVILGMFFIGPKKFFQCRGHDKAREAAIHQILEDEKRTLGPISWAEGSAMGILLLVIVLWVTRKPGVDGWSVLTVSKVENKKTVEYVTDSQPAVLGTILLCVWPAINPFRRRRADETTANPLETVLPWKVASSKCPWTVLFLIGGGFALSDICSYSGLSKTVSTYMLGLKSLPVFALILVFSLLSMIMTTFVANAATANVLLPIMFELSENLNIHPYYLGLPVTIAASMAFMLPAGTPANAIVYSKGRVNINQMMLVGALIAVAGVCIVTLCTVSYAIPIFGLNQFPAWAQGVNVTTTATQVFNATTTPTP
ncbi:unnamed protein product [Hymenolepis diminuta]|uniref:Uncharacterized protein n=2 Tax=Hymenolepis diminuta TaxID=6216 RepID=A0A564Y1V5_HYMDI|nr:unnamed protein product [Hymenolepis diminuta]